MDRMKVMALMQIIHRIIGRHHNGLVRLDEPTFELFEIAKRIRDAKDEEQFQRVLADLCDFRR